MRRGFENGDGLLGEIQIKLTLNGSHPAPAFFYISLPDSTKIYLIQLSNFGRRWDHRGTATAYCSPFKHK